MLNTKTLGERRGRPLTGIDTLESAVPACEAGLADYRDELRLRQY